ncbi:MAG: contractile injection system tape measure protein, partial [Bacteroidota bacterium]
TAKKTTTRTAEAQQEDFEKADSAVTNSQAKTRQQQQKQHTKIATTQQHFQQWLMFLVEGYLPWNAPKMEAVLWQKAILQALENNPSSVTALKNQLQQQPIAIQRLILQYEDSFLAQLTTQLSNWTAAQTIPWKKEVEELIFNLNKNKKIHTQNTTSSTRTAIWTWLIKAKWCANEQTASFLDFLLQFFEITLSEEAAFLQKISDLLSSKEKTYSTIQNLLPQLTQQLQSKLKHLTQQQQDFSSTTSDNTDIVSNSSNTDSPKAADDLKATNNASKAEANKENATLKSSNDPKKLDDPKTLVNETAIEREAAATADELNEEESKTTFKKEDTKQSETETTALSDEMPKASDTPFLKKEKRTTAQAFYIENAGIILLHPFLKPLFTACDLLEGKGFKSPTEQYKAIYLLHYLASGNTNAHEYELVLAKFLCGLALNHPIPKDIELKKETLKEADHLLKTIIQHWSALGNTSPDGLREGFLQRTGKLVQDQDKWRLQIEPKTIDILLDRLPWGINMIQLAWKKELLIVEWNP